MLGKISFVDSKRFNKGVSLDTIHQLAILAVKPGSKIDLAEVSRAVRAAGFDPMSLYQRKSKKLLTSKLK